LWSFDGIPTYVITHSFDYISNTYFHLAADTYVILDEITKEKKEVVISTGYSLKIRGRYTEFKYLKIRALNIL